MADSIITPEEVRAMIERTEARNTELRAKYPHSAHIFPPITDETFRWIMERALLGELRRTPLLPPLDDDASADDAKPVPPRHFGSRSACSSESRV